MKISNLSRQEVMQKLIENTACSECTIVEGNRELIQIYEEKVKKVIEKVREG